MLVLFVLTATFCLCLLAWQNLAGERLGAADRTTSPASASKTADITADTARATTERRTHASPPRASRPASTSSSTARRSEGLSLAWVAITAVLVTGAACTRWVFSRSGRRPSRDLLATSAPSDRQAGIDPIESQDLAPEQAAAPASASRQVRRAVRTEVPVVTPLGSPAGAAPAPEAPVATPAGPGAVPSAGSPVLDEVSQQVTAAAAIGSPRVAAAEAGPDLRSTAPDESRRVLVDRRMKPRFPYEAAALLRWRGCEVDVRTVDLSESGARLRLPRLRPQDPPVPLHLELVTVLLTVGGAELAIRSEVRFRRLTEDGADLGVQFQDLAEADTRRLRDVVESAEELVH